MKRRDLLGTIGTGSAMILAGCLDEETEESDYEPADSINGRDRDYDENSDEGENEVVDDEEEEEEEEEKEIKENPAPRGFNVDFVDIHSFDSNELVIDMNISQMSVPEPSDDINVCDSEDNNSVCEDPVPVEVEVYMTERSGEELTYNYNTMDSQTPFEWSDDKKIFVPDPEQGFNPKPISTIQFESADKLLASTRLEGESHMQTDGFWAGEVTFDIDTSEIQNYRQFGLTFKLKVPDEDELPQFDEEMIIDSSQQILRTGEDTFIYPRRVDYSETTPSFNQIPDFSHLDISDRFIQESDGFDRESLEFEDDSATFTHTRVSTYSRYSDKAESHVYNYPEDEHNTTIGAGFVPHHAMATNADMPAYDDSVTANVWGIQYEITEDEFQAARQKLESLGDGFSLNPLVGDVLHLLSYDELAPVRRVAEKLYDVCEDIGATEPVAQYRVVMDFVQYFEYDTGVYGNFDEPELDVLSTPDNVDNPIATNTPVETLAYGFGDCGDRSVLAHALLSSHPFNFDVVVPIYETPIDNIEHTAIGVSYDDLGITDSEGDAAHTASFHNEPQDPIHHNGETYLFTELTGPFRMSERPKEWERAQFVDELDHVLS